MRYELFDWTSMTVVGRYVTFDEAHEAVRAVMPSGHQWEILDRLNGGRDVSSGAGPILAPRSPR
jgi:hypothetical protein